MLSGVGYTVLCRYRNFKMGEIAINVRKKIDKIRYWP